MFYIRKCLEESRLLLHKELKFTRDRCLRVFEVHGGSVRFQIYTSLNIFQQAIYRGEMAKNYIEILSNFSKYPVILGIPHITGDLEGLSLISKTLWFGYFWGGW